MNPFTIPIITVPAKYIMKRIGTGESNSEIAHALFLSEGTVKNYVSALYNKVGVKNRHEAIRLARKIGIIS